MNYDKLLSEIKRIHFIGIGGAGMCPMAEILLADGYEITGSDIFESDSLKRIKGYGIKVYDTHSAENVNGVQLVVHTAAVKRDNPEIVQAEKLGIPVIERCILLGVLSRRYKQTLAVSGTHGKTTTTAMLTEIFIKAGKDPSAIIGGKLPSLGGNSIVGESDVMVCEACEYADSFLQLDPYVSLILNIEEDHLDYFKDLSAIKRSFRQFATQTQQAIIANGEDKNVADCLKQIDKKVITFGFSDSCDYMAEVVSSDKNSASECFILKYKGEDLCKIQLKVPGKHNVQDALAASSVAHFMGISPDKIKLALEQFGGVHRRFEVLGTIDGITVADDFAHHPTELTAVLSSAKKMSFNRVIAVFQPHTFSRTFLLMNDFAKALAIPDIAVISEILPVREVNTYGVSSEQLVEKIPNAIYKATFEEITEYVLSIAKPNDLILTLGGGNVYFCANMIYDRLKSKQ